MLKQYNINIDDESLRKGSFSRLYLATHVLYYQTHDSILARLCRIRSNMPNYSPMAIAPIALVKDSCFLIGKIDESMQLQGCKSIQTSMPFKIL